MIVLTKADYSNYHEREARAVNLLKRRIPQYLRKGIVRHDFVVLAEESRKSYSATAVDGPGTKPILAIAMNKFSTIGIDVVAMVANDMATLGNVNLKEFIDYLPCQKKIQ